MKPAILVLVCLLAACGTGEQPEEKRLNIPKPPEEGVVSRIAFGSCIKQGDPQPIWDAVMDFEPELFLFLGDNVYGDVSGDDPLMPELRAAYDAQSRVPGFARLRAEVPHMAIWDDHDYGTNDGGGDFALQKESKALFLDFWGVDPGSERARRAGLYHAEILGPPGRRVQIILLDTRAFRGPLTASTAQGRRYDPEPDPQRTMLGAAQWSWLKEQLQKPAELRVLVSSIQVIAEGHGWESWQTLPTERDRLFELMKTTRAGGVVMLSGDRHLGGLYKSSAGPYPIFELTSSAMNAPLNREVTEPGPKRVGEVYTAVNFGTLVIDWGRAEVTLALRDLEGDEVLEQTILLQDLPGQ